jgi:transmembrane sensor
MSACAREKARNERLGQPSGMTSLDEIAAAWVLRRREGLSAREEQEFTAWLSADSTHRTAFEQNLRAWEIAGSAAAHPRLLEMRSRALMTRPRRQWRLPLAASLAGLALVGGMGAVLLLPSGTPPSHEAAQASPAIYQTAVGERSTITLADGSVVTLNTNSRLKVRFTRGERDLVLIAGQALFQVAHDAARPFVVSALDREVVATGTEFEVRIDRRALRVALLQGHVVVRQAANGAGRSPASQPTALAPGEQLVAINGAPVSVARADVAALTSWREGRVRFADTPLSEAVAEMNRYSDTPIIIEDRAAGEIRISGAFRTGRSSDFAAAVASLFPVRASEAGGEIRLRSAA